MELSQFKKELSKIAGINFFDPKYRDVFKRFVESGSDAEDAKLKELGAEVQADEDVNTELTEKKEEAEIKAENLEVNTDGKPEAEDIFKPEVSKVEINEKPQDEPVKLDTELQETIPEVENNVETKTGENDELLNTKLELALVKAHVREDRLEDAKEFLLTKIASINDIALVPQILARYPEWVESATKETPKPFGMPIGDRIGLTAEERRLKELGADIGK